MQPSFRRSVSYTLLKINPSLRRKDHPACVPSSGRGSNPPFGGRAKAFQADRLVLINAAWLARAVAGPPARAAFAGKGPVGRARALQEEFPGFQEETACGLRCRGCAGLLSRAMRGSGRAGRACMSRAPSPPGAKADRQTFQPIAGRRFAPKFHRIGHFRVALGGASSLPSTFHRITPTW